MDTPSNLFDEYYYRHDCGERPYQRDEAWLNFFDGIAEKIVRKIGPKSVMDAGCAMGFLVEGLRKRDVDAFGVDISSYAISVVHPSIKEYCWEGSITSPFPQKYELITCIEVLEHMPMEDAELAIKNFCQYSDDILFSSTPFDFKETTHVNVRQPEYWAEQFATYGFYRDVDFDASFITAWAVRFRKRPLKLNELVRQYEKHYFMLKKENADLRNFANESKTTLGYYEKSFEEIEQVKDHFQLVIDQLTNEIDGLRNNLSEEAQKINDLENELEKVLTSSHELNVENINLKQLNSFYEEKVQNLSVENQKFQELVAGAYRDLDIIKDTETWKFMMALGRFRQKMAPNSSWRAKVLDLLLSPIRNSMNKRNAKKKGGRKLIHNSVKQILDLINKRGLKITVKKSWEVLRTEGFFGLVRKIKALSSGQNFAANITPGDNIIPNEDSSLIKVTEVRLPQKPETHSKSIDIIICVHNALTDVQNCIQSVFQNSTRPYRLIIVNDGSDIDTKGYLREIAHENKDIILLENSSALGYTKAANQGISASSADYVILLNSDTIVPPEWLDRMIQPFLINSRVGIVGPISNTASWQSVPDLLENGDWAQNTLPNGISIDEMGKLVSNFSPQIYPSVPLLNGFCLMIRRELIADIGLLDEINFPMGYGEEDDYIFRARKAGWQLAWADDVYVYHAQSRSYSHERRKLLTEKGLANLRVKHGSILIDESCGYASESIILQGIRIYNSNLYERAGWVKQGKDQFEGKRVLFLLPVAFAGGGANVIIDEARSMIEMGVDVRIFNLVQNRVSFIQSYPNLDIPVTFGEVKDLETFALLFDAVIATVYFTVEWLKTLDNLNVKKVVLFGYYIQGFEPLIFPNNTDNYYRALKSYTMVSEVIPFTKTDWTKNEVARNTGTIPRVIGISVNTSLFRPRFEKNKAPIRISAMIRPSTQYREPEKTLAILKEISKIYRDQVEIWIFGAKLDDPDFTKLPLDFDWKSAGLLTQKQVANFLGMTDIFVDFSSHQAMGLTALEAMSCGCCVIVPENGGAIEFVKSGINGFVVNTNSHEDCVNQLKVIIEDAQLREQTQIEAIKTVNKYYPEKAAYNILKTLFVDQLK